MKAPPLKNDCFALPPGVAWAPVDEALALLSARLTRTVGVPEPVAVHLARGRILAQPVRALRANPPGANAAVDGYGFAGGREEGLHSLSLVPGRSAPGEAFAGTVPEGAAIRILTGALLPQGVDTIVLEEDSALDGDHIAFHGPIKAGANARAAGEDVTAGAEILPVGRRLTSADIALLSATGTREVMVWPRLRVAVLSTGSELIAPDPTLGPEWTFDANRPMLLSLAAQWGFEPVDLGPVSDDAEAVTHALSRGARDADVILTSGGASASEEDHISAALNDAGSMALWRIAIKPGRPLALGVWDGTPVFGLPGNPVAAFVCTLVFARPALWQLAGGAFEEPQGFDVPAAFSKRKKPGRSEYLRARLRGGQVEVFGSEGSGRVYGLSWAEGLVALPEEAAKITPGTPVRYIPFGSFGL